MEEKDIDKDTMKLYLEYRDLRYEDEKKYFYKAIEDLNNKIKIQSELIKKQGEVIELLNKIKNIYEKRY